jgi:glycosyltransferase involved in cell wall biosynthesis
MEQIFELTILVPVFNEADNLPRVERELTAFITAAPVKTKVLFINDGSSDQSASVIESICATNPSFFFIHLERNHGLSTALKAGFDAVDTRFTGYIDADLQTSPQDFLKLLEYCNEYDLVNGIRVNRKDTSIKKLSSKIANAIRRSVTHDGSSDTGCPLKIMHTELLKKIPFFKGMHRFIPALVLLAGGTVKEVPVSHYPRLAGKSNYHLWNRLTGPLMDLFAFSWMQRHYIRYQIIKKG